MHELRALSHWLRRHCHWGRSPTGRVSCSYHLLFLPRGVSGGEFAGLTFAECAQKCCDSIVCMSFDWQAPTGPLAARRTNKQHQPEEAVASSSRALSNAPATPQRFTIRRGPPSARAGQPYNCAISQFRDDQVPPQRYAYRAGWSYNELTDRRHGTGGGAAEGSEGAAGPVECWLLTDARAAEDVAVVQFAGAEEERAVGIRLKEQCEELTVSPASSEASGAGGGRRTEGRTDWRQTWRTDGGQCVLGRREAC